MNLRGIHTHLFIGTVCTLGMLSIIGCTPVSGGDDDVGGSIGPGPAANNPNEMGGTDGGNDIELGPCKDTLKILVMDHSGGLVGLDPDSGSLDPSIRSDQADARITFFNFWLGNTDNEFYISVVRMNDQASPIVNCDNDSPCGPPNRVCSSPTRDKDEARCSIDALQAGEGGRTPMNQTLKSVFSALVNTNVDLNIEVILFTDGVEDGDPSGDMTAPGEAVDLYANGIDGKEVPVTVIHIQPPETSPYPRGEDAQFKSLADKSGGEYFFIPDVGELLMNDQMAIIDAISNCE